MRWGTHGGRPFSLYLCCTRVGPSRGLSRARWFSSRPKQVRLLPYKFSEQEAKDIWVEWTKKQWLSPTSLRSTAALTRSQGVFLPFYVYEADVVTEFSADVLQNKRAWNWSTFQFETVQEWTKETVASPKVVYSKNDPDLQVFASYSYKLELVQCVKSPLNEAKDQSELTEHDMNGKDFERFGMHTTSSRQRMMERVQAAEAKKGPAVLSQHFPGQQTHNIASRVHITYHRQNVYLPAYIMEYTRLGRQFRCFVNGYTGAIFGQEQVSFVKVVALAHGVGLLLLSPAFGASAIGIVSPSAVFIGAVATVYPFYRQYVREATRLADEARDFGQTSSHTHGPSGRRFFWQAYQEEFARFTSGGHRRTSRYETDYSSRSPSQATTLKRHYRTLGVTQTATLEDLQQAFRTLSFRWHPDRFFAKSQAEKKHANDTYREIIKAYQTLRDPRKRSLYDMTDEA